MKTLCLSKIAQATLAVAGLLASLVFLPPTEAQTPPSTSAEKNSFQAVTSHLDPGGRFFLYLSTEQWLAHLSDQVGQLRQLFTSLPQMDATAQAQVGRAFDVATQLIKHSGVEQVSGVGASSIAKEPGFYRNKIFVHHYPGQEAGYLWSWFGRAPHRLEGLDLLPRSTALAGFFDLELPLVWQALQADLGQAGLPEAEGFFRQFPSDFQRHTGLDFQQLLGSLGGSFGLALTLDESRKVTLPLPTGQNLEIPEPGLLIAIKVKDDTLFNHLDAVLSQNPQVVRVDQNGLKMRSMNLPPQFPLPLRPTIARSGDYLFLASSDRLVEEALAVQKGQKPGLQTTDEFKHLAQSAPDKGNRFGFMSRRFGQTLSQALQTVVTERAGGGMGGAEPAVRKMMTFLGAIEPVSNYSVSANTPEGWMIESQGNQDLSKGLLLSSTILPVSIGAGMILPALAQAKTKAQSIACANNLKQIGLAARIWATDHNDKLPKDFLTMKDELGTPRILICPGDQARSQYLGSSWSDMDSSKITYDMVSPGASDSEPDKDYVRCPIHGSTVKVDGSVRIGRQR